MASSRSSSPPSFALVVESNALVRMDAVDILEDAGFRVLDMATGDAAVVILRQHGAAVTLLFTAVGLQGAHDGFALARVTAADYPHISIVVASGHETPGPGDLPETACFIEKPFSAGIVHAHLQRILPEDRKPGPLKEQAKLDR
ncbi:response regulator [Methylobacterium sp. 37f]|uniref:response regulator n=1 Tax=Methylobacterium sp. 37f TaxID=2817058 RepID=UPI001FFD3090|nr:response regulator [Methylobacterium sp. 37f]MCK2053775.1 response regulator [Methylobacterium sp. 37f]